MITNCLKSFIVGCFYSVYFQEKLISNHEDILECSTYSIALLCL